MATVDEITKPSDCLFCMCLPLTKEDFFRSLEPGCNKNYSKIRQQELRYNPEALWENDHLPLVNLFFAQKNKLEKKGVTFCLNFKLADLKRINNYKATALFAHHDPELKQVEFFDGLHDISSIIQHIPPGYDKVLDLTMCMSVPLQTEIKKNFRDCLVAANKMDTIPELRLLCYSKAICFLDKENIGYEDAIFKVRRLL